MPRRIKRKRPAAPGSEVRRALWGGGLWGQRRRAAGHEPRASGPLQSIACADPRHNNPQPLTSNPAHPPTPRPPLQIRSWRSTMTTSSPTRPAARPTSSCWRPRCAGSGKSSAPTATPRGDRGAPRRALAHRLPPLLAAALTAAGATSRAGAPRITDSAAVQGQRAARTLYRRAPPPRPCTALPPLASPSPLPSLAPLIGAWRAGPAASLLPCRWGRLRPAAAPAHAAHNAGVCKRPPVAAHAAPPAP
jgi:hypothetical protein